VTVPSRCSFWNLFSIGLDLDRDRLEESRNACGREQDVAEEFQGALVAMFCDRAMFQITRRPASRLVVATRNAALAVFGRTAANISCVTRFSTRRLSGQVSNRLRRCLVLEDVGGRDVGEVLAQFLVVAGAEKGVVPDQRAMLAPVTTAKSGGRRTGDHPVSRPAPNAPSEPPPEQGQPRPLALGKHAAKIGF